MILAGKTVVVTGAGPGLGRETARLVLRDGGNVVLGARDEEKLERLATELDPSGDRVALRATDITEASHSVSLAELAIDRFGGVDGLVQVAAKEAMGGLGKTSDAVWTEILDANVVGTMHVVTAMTDAMGDGGGSIVLIGSQTFRVSAIGGQQTAYAASKGALHSAMFHLATEFGPRKIRVNMIVPSWMWGPAVQRFVKAQAERRGVDEAKIVGEIAKPMALGEIPTPADIAESAVFFCSDRARMITGQTLYVNAGNFMT